MHYQMRNLLTFDQLDERTVFPSIRLYVSLPRFSDVRVCGHSLRVSQDRGFVHNERDGSNVVLSHTVAH